MIDARLPLALAEGGVVLPADGVIAVFQPPRNAFLEDVPKERAQIIRGFKPDFDAFAARGFDCAVSCETRLSASLVCVPRSKREARAVIAQALALTDGPVFIDGQKTDGIDSLLRDMRKRVSVCGPISKAHGKLFWLDQDRSDNFADWAEGPELTDGGFWTAPGVFSADAIDPASTMLAEALPGKLGEQVADLGAGWGFLAAHVLTRENVKAVHLVEAGHMALECARRNVMDPRAEFHWADVTRWSPAQRMDAVVMNPPFHTGRAADPSLGQAFVVAAASVLAPHGQLWMVANRHLPYETILQAQFAKVQDLGGDGRFKLLHAVRPIRMRK